MKVGYVSVRQQGRQVCEHIDMVQELKKKKKVMKIKNNANQIN